MRRAVLALLAPLVLLGSVHADAAAPQPQVVDPVGDAVGTKAQDIASVLFRTVGPAKSRTLVVTMTLGGDVMQQVGGLNYEVDAHVTCGDVSFSYSPGTVFAAGFSVNGWVESSCGGDYLELVTVNVQGPTITWELALDKTVFTKGTAFTEFEARVDPAQPAAPLPSSSTGTTLGLLDIAKAAGPWKLS